MLMFRQPLLLFLVISSRCVKGGYTWNGEQWVWHNNSRAAGSGDGTSQDDEDNNELSGSGEEMLETDPEVLILPRPNLGSVEKIEDIVKDSVKKPAPDDATDEEIKIETVLPTTTNIPEAVSSKKSIKESFLNATTLSLDTSEVIEIDATDDESRNVVRFASQEIEESVDIENEAVIIDVGLDGTAILKPIVTVVLLIPIFVIKFSHCISI